MVLICVQRRSPSPALSDALIMMTSNAPLSARSTAATGSSVISISNGRGSAWRIARVEFARSSTIRIRPQISALSVRIVVAFSPTDSSASARSSSSSVIVFRRSRLFTRVSNATWPTGLVRKSSAPHSSPFTRSSALSSEVTMTTGTCAVRGLAFKAAQTSKPVMSGIITSRSTRSTRSFSATSSASRPESAVRTSKYSACRRDSRSRTLAAISSTTRTRDVTAPDPQAGPT